jgi:phage-related protein
VPTTKILFYQEKKGDSPIVEWLRKIREKDPKGFLNCLARVEQLQMSGYELRRPAADYLQDGIYELRAKHRNVQYRLLYFFYGGNIAVIDHGMIKEQSAVPPIDLKNALERKKKFEQNPEKHTFEGVIDT